MDPIAIVGVVITIGTFVKDIIKIAQQIQNSIDKVSVYSTLVEAYLC
jgi:hypothetical protein